MRYLIEADDEFGRINYDRFDDLEAAIKVAKRLAGSNAQVIDTDEMIVVWEEV